MNDSKNLRPVLISLNGQEYKVVDWTPGGLWTILRTREGATPFTFDPRALNKWNRMDVLEWGQVEREAGAGKKALWDAPIEL